MNNILCHIARYKVVGLRVAKPSDWTDQRPFAYVLVMFYFSATVANGRRREGFDRDADGPCPHCVEPGRRGRAKIASASRS